MFLLFIVIYLCDEIPSVLFSSFRGVMFHVMLGVTLVSLQAHLQRKVEPQRLIEDEKLSSHKK